MAGFSIDSSELLKLGADLGKIPATAEKLSRVAVRKTAADIKSTARSTVAVDTGNLKSSISTKATGPLESTVSADTPYAVYVETGTSRMAAQPYMRPAADHHTPAFEQAMSEIVGRALNGS